MYIINKNFIQCELDKWHIKNLLTVVKLVKSSLTEWLYQ